MRAVRTCGHQPCEVTVAASTYCNAVPSPVVSVAYTTCIAVTPPVAPPTSGVLVVPPSLEHRSSLEALTVKVFIISLVVPEEAGFTLPRQSMTPSPFAVT